MWFHFALFQVFLFSSPIYAYAIKTKTMRTKCVYTQKWVDYLTLYYLWCALNLNADYILPPKMLCLCVWESVLAFIVNHKIATVSWSLMCNIFASSTLMIAYINLFIKQNFYETPTRFLPWSMNRSLGRQIN